MVFVSEVKEVHDSRERVYRIGVSTDGRIPILRIKLCFIISVKESVNRTTPGYGLKLGNEK